MKAAQIIMINKNTKQTYQNYITKTAATDLDNCVFEIKDYINYKDFNIENTKSVKRMIDEASYHLYCLAVNINKYLAEHEHITRSENENKQNKNND